MANTRQPGPVCVESRPWLDIRDGTLHLGKSPLPGPALEVAKKVIGAFRLKIVERLDLNHCVFFDEYEKHKLPFGTLSSSARSALGGLLDKLCADPDIRDLRWVAYMLATTIHECRSAANKWVCTWTPVSESGGSAKSYGAEQVAVDWHGWPLGSDGKPVAAGPDPTSHAKKRPDPNAKTIKARYYGRGYVQITHQDNYRAMDDALGLGGKLVVNPELALDPKVAYQIMSYGMRTGSFRGERKRSSAQGYHGGEKLGDYISGLKKDYLNARNIINGGLDQARTIRKHAKTFEDILTKSQNANALHLGTEWASSR